MRCEVFSPELLYLDENSMGLTKKSGLVQQKKPLTIKDMCATNKCEHKLLFYINP